MSSRGITTDKHGSLVAAQLEQALAAKPTNNPEAYDAYLRGLAIESRGHYFSYIGPSSEPPGLYERAVQLDPNFALAWARLSRADSLLYFNGEPRGDAAKRALEHAQKLAPNSPDTLLALGYYQYHVLGDYEIAKATFQRVRQMLPGNTEAPLALGLVTRRQEHWDESSAYFEEGLALDPHNLDVLTEAARNSTYRRQFTATLKLQDRVLDIMPNDPDVMASRATAPCEPRIRISPERKHARLFA